MLLVIEDPTIFRYDVVVVIVLPTVGTIVFAIKFFPVGIEHHFMQHFILLPAFFIE